MLEDLLTDMTMSLAASGAGLAVVCFIAGWLGKGLRASNTVTELKREISSLLQFLTATERGEWSAVDLLTFVYMPNLNEWHSPVP